MKLFRLPTVLICLLAIGIFGVATVVFLKIQNQFGKPALFTGWTLVGTISLLALFNIRKRLPMLPLGNASTWLFLHAVFGVLALGLFWLHTRLLWPQGIYEQLLSLFFYAITASGFLGWFFQRIYPRRLTETGLEVIYEQIPNEMAILRERCENLILACTKEAAADTLAKHYMDSMEWFFRRPRFFLSHALGGGSGRRWIHQQLDPVKRYLNQVENRYLSDLEVLAQTKDKLDLHYSVQSILKGWLFFHVPVTVALIALIIWHLILVYVYAI
jgi:hypothetical protein